ncbi:MAG: thiamine pyrophosphate-dependent enzyme, partial [Acidobacteriaceae bacterium]
HTAGFGSGYRGSPLGGLDLTFLRAGERLAAEDIVFQPGLNEDLAATAIWGAQQAEMRGEGRYDGVFGLWYGKGPGVDRSADALRHANFTGASPKGGVLALAGDDHGAKSSTAVNFSDTLFIAVGMPVLYPSNTQELLDLGLHGVAMSRFSGCWVGMKVVTDVAEGGGTVYVGADRPEIVIPERPSNPPGGLGPRVIDAPVAQEERLYQHKLPAALAYARANGLNRIIDDGEAARIGVVAAGKAWQDLLQALGNLGGDDGAALGLRLLKVGMVWPLDPVIVRDFARGLDLIVVIEEKRPLLEDQIRSILYGDPRAPRIVGKYFDGLAFDASPGSPAIPNYGEITPELVAGVLVKAVSEHDPNCALSAPEAPGAALSNRPAPMRSPGFCAGCPHNRSTPVPEGSRALAGIGCHWMATLVNPQQTATASHMGGEGAMWLGQEPFTNEEHVFANIGDGTYAHSGSLAIRQAIAADVPITYKILFNGFVSMTGGQPIEGGMTPTQILGELAAEGVKKMALVVDDLDRYAGVALPPNVTLRHRDAMDATQREFREYKGVSVILYDQPCATERRRLRKRGKWAD